LGTQDSALTVYRQILIWCSI